MCELSGLLVGMDSIAAATAAASAAARSASVGEFSSELGNGLDGVVLEGDSICSASSREKDSGGGGDGDGDGDAEELGDCT